jgi:carotenoid cleavage dioxygenase-like enzyme
MSSAESPSEDLPFHLKGNFAPVFEERTELDLEVTGAIPPELDGHFFRNGSNPQSGTSPHWFFGNGMVHGIDLQGGKAQWYRNRYVRTPAYLDPEGGGMGSGDRTRSLANTHIIHHAGKLLALEEGSFPWVLTKELETVGPFDYDGGLQSAMTAHPRVCPETGELLFFGYSPVAPFLTYHRVSKDGKLVQSEEITVKGPTMMHDWNITRNHVIFMDRPLMFDISAIAEGKSPIYWNADYGARLGVMPRDGKDSDVVWYELDPCFVFHPMNAYENGDEIIIDVARFEKMAFGPDDGEGSPSMLHRWTLDTKTQRVSTQLIDDRPADFPRVHDRVVGLKHRYGYMTGMGSEGMDEMGSELFKYDLDSGKSWTHDLGGCLGGEPVFAESPGAAGEDEGWVLTFAYDPSTDKSDLLILDASNFEAPPVARIHLPTRVPYGFHGSWVARDS